MRKYSLVTSCPDTDVCSTYNATQSAAPRSQVALMLQRSQAEFHREVF